jgi:hypothetical protein
MRLFANPRLYRQALTALQLSLAVFFILPVVAQAQIEITLKKSFIEKYKDRATIEADFFIDKAHKKPNPPGKDGDMHIAGRSPEEIGLPVVAEIMNASDVPAAVKAVHAAEGNGEAVPLIGVWRIWCEHAGGDKQVQGEPLEPFDTTNPEHVFEIHPVTKFKNLKLLTSLKPIVGFKFKDAEQAFLTYERTRSRIIPGGDTATIVTRMAGFNYVDFKIGLLADPFEVEDGMMVMASVLDLKGDLLVHKRRMVFVKGSAPEKAVKNKTKGSVLHVIGVPRINLKLVSWRLENAAERPEILEWDLPYEMVIVGVFKK